MAKIVVGIPCFGSMPPETETDYMRLMYYLGRRYQEHEFFLAIKRKAEQFRARNGIVEAAYQANADYVWMLDDDQVIDVEDGQAPSPRYEILRRLLEHFEAQPDAGIIGALYYHRGGECRPVLMLETAEDPDRYRFVRDDEITYGLQEVAVQGGGCMLIKMRVFDKIGAECFEPEHEYGTDLQVCRKARKAGFKVFCDTSIELGHVRAERSVVTSKNRHQHYSTILDRSDNILLNARVGHIYRDFRKDVMEYLDIDSVARMVELAQMYERHTKRFAEYADPKQYYRDSKEIYLARACFIKSEQNVSRFDDFVLSAIKATSPGTGLDFGCGAAPITFELCRKGQQVYFCDIPGTAPYEFLKWRARKYNLAGTRALFVDDQEHDWPAPKTLDWVTCLDSIEHLPDGVWQRVVSDIAGSLVQLGGLIKNFILLEDLDNAEHVFMDKPEFMKHCVQNLLYPLAPAIFQKREDAASKQKRPLYAVN